MFRQLRSHPACLALCALAFWPSLAAAQTADRRGTMVPGLVLDAGGRHGSCDVLLFAPGGNELLAAGDDKVVRRWAVAADGALTPAGSPLRWSIYREQRGCIFAAALSPDGGKIAVGGFGMQNGMCAVLDRATGEVVHTLDRPLSTQVTWAMAYAPSGRYVVLGDAHGQLWRWELASKGEPTPFAGSEPKLDAKGQLRTNRARLIAFLDATRFLAVCQDGALRVWDVSSPKQPPRALGAFDKKGLLRVTISGTAASKSRWLAALGDNVGGGGSKTVELLNLSKVLTEGKVAAASRRIIELARDRAEYPTAVAFDAAAGRLAVGTQVEVAESKPERNFTRVIGGHVRFYDLARGDWLPAVLNIRYRTDNVAWRPGHADQVATAGGPNHEVRTWAVSKGRKVSEVRTPGSGLWAVAFSADNKYFAWRDRHETAAPTPNSRGAGPWRVFEIKSRKLLPAPPKDFRPVRPIEEQDGWRVLATNNGYVWRVVGPQGTDVRLDTPQLYPTGFNQLPRCYTFLPREGKGPVRLAVGHMWGVSVYELRPGRVRLARLLTGHEGEVTALAPSRDGKLLLTASRDQTVCCWSLVDWPEQRELGVSFEKKAGRVVVKKVMPGSPGWETEMTEGDQLLLVASPEPGTAAGWVYNPTGIDLAKRRILMKATEKVDDDGVLARLRAAQPGREYILIYRDDIKSPLVQKLTTVRQRPLWRFFPTRADQGGEWIIWRWRDFYYDTASPRADKLLGWHVNAGGFAARPRFHALDEFRGSGTALGTKGGSGRGYHRPDRVWPTVLEAFQAPEKVTFEQIEPPEVRVTITTRPGANADLVLNVIARPYAGGVAQQNVTRLLVWLDDYLLPVTVGTRPAIANGAVNGALTIPRGELREGPNRVTVMAYNAAGGRGAASAEVDYTSGEAVVRTLHALCVGVSDYSKARHQGGGVSDLRCAHNDALALRDVFNQHANSGIYRKADARALTQGQVTAARVEKELRDVARRVGKDDLFILFLAGHGDAREDKKKSSYTEGSFYYICSDSDTSKPQTCLTSARLYELLAGIRCRKLVILDACHSGDVASNPIRDFNRDGVPFIIMSACGIHQKAGEPNAGFGVDNGFFTLCLLEALGEPATSKGKPRRRALTPVELRQAVSSRLPPLLKEWNVKPEDQQVPVYFPEPLPALRLLARP